MYFYEKQEGTPIMKIEIDLKESTYPRIIAEMKRRFADKTAVIDHGTKLSYFELCEQSERLGAYFLEKGIRPKDKVILHLGNTHLFIKCLFALELIGAVPVIVFSSCRELEISSIAGTTEAAAYISFRSFRGQDRTESVLSIRKKYPTIRTLLFDDEIVSADISGYVLDNADRADPSPDDIAYIVLSGGSTGVPKLIPKKQSATLWSAEKCAESCGLNETTRYLTAMPCSHYFHICGPGFMGTFIRGGTDIMCFSSLPSEIIELIQQERITETALVPSVASECIAYAEKHCDDLSEVFRSLRLVQLGGSMCTADIINAVAAKMHCIPQQIYGMGEGLVYATYPDFPLDMILKYQGINTSEYDSVKVVDTDGNEVPTGEFGELIAKGPNIATEYYRNDEANRTKFTKDGYYRTGDRVRLVDGKYLQVVGRIDDMINRGGEKIFPAELEMHIRKCTNVRDAAVFGIPDAQMGNLITAFVIPEDETSAAEIRKELLASGLASFKIPDAIFFRSEFPLTSVKKIDKNALKKEAAELMKQTAEEMICTFDDISDPVMKKAAICWAQTLRTTEIKADSNFIELGGNSISAAEMLQKLNVTFGTDLNMEDLYTAADLSALSEIIKERLSDDK